MKTEPGKRLPPFLAGFIVLSKRITLFPPGDSPKIGQNPIGNPRKVKVSKDNPNTRFGGA
jgi:hypothetical protein